MRDPKESDLKSLIQVPLEVVKKLEDPFLLVGIGVAAICAIIAISRVHPPGDRAALA
jgi:CBS-domain-containing membrane protein